MAATKIGSQQIKNNECPNVFQGLKYFFFKIIIAITKTRKATIKAEIPKVSITKIFPSQSPTLLKILEDFTVLSNIFPFRLWLDFQLDRKEAKEIAMTIEITMNDNPKNILTLESVFGVVAIGFLGRVVFFSIISMWANLTKNYDEFAVDFVFFLKFKILFSLNFTVFRKDFH
jgi:hypothetical protein